MSLSSLRAVFAGTPDFAAEHLRYLIEKTDIQVVAVYTQPDRPAGRGKKLTPSPVKSLALEHDLPVEQPLNFKETESLETLNAYQADIMIVVAYGIILPQSVLDTPRLGCINVHASLLPRWRGAAPIQRAIESGDKETGITIMQMDKGLDTGDMLAKTSCPIEEGETAGALHDKLISLGSPLLVKVLQQFVDQAVEPEVQDHSLSTYADKITKQEAQLNWSDNAQLLLRKICAFNPFPICYFSLQDKSIRVWQAELCENNSKSNSPGTILHSSKNGIQISCGEGSLLLTSLQLPGKKALPVKDILNANGELFANGTVLQ